MEENWKPILGYDGLYQISNFGKVKSLSRIEFLTGAIPKRFRKEKVLLPFPNKGGYLSLVLTKNKIHKTIMVHRLVAQAFIPNPENKLTVNHIDGNKLNNCSTNLEWVTQSENILHAYSIGLSRQRKGENSPVSKLTNSQVKEIRQLDSTNSFTRSELASKFGVKKGTIRAIVTKKTWKHL